MITYKEVEAMDIYTEDVDIYNLFDRDISYPDHSLILNGLKDGMNFTYISNTYLNGFINYVDIIGGYMVRKYQGEKEKWDEACSNVDALLNEPHTNISDAHKFDDILILARGAGSYWLFWNDGDCSDCCIGRLSMDTFDGQETAMLYLKKTLIKISSSYNIMTSSDSDYFKYLSEDHFRGWITL